MIVYCLGKKVRINIKNQFISIQTMGGYELYDPYNLPRLDSNLERQLNNRYTATYSPTEDTALINAFSTDDSIRIFMDRDSAKKTQQLTSTYCEGPESNKDISIIYFVPPMFAIRVRPEFIEERIVVTSQRVWSEEKTNWVLEEQKEIQYFISQKNILEKVYIDFILNNDLGKFLDLNNQKKNKYAGVLFKKVFSDNSSLVGVTEKKLDNNVLKNKLVELCELCSKETKDTHKMDRENLKATVQQMEYKRESSSSVRYKIFNILLTELLDLPVDKRKDDYGSMLTTLIQYFETGYRYLELVSQKTKDVLSQLNVCGDMSNLVVSYLEENESNHPMQRM